MTDCGSGGAGRLTSTALQLNDVPGSPLGVVLGAVMLRFGVFRLATGYCAIVANVGALCLYVPTVGIVLPFCRRCSCSRITPDWTTAAQLSRGV